jgi:hypothetical protein
MASGKVTGSPSPSSWLDVGQFPEKINRQIASQNFRRPVRAAEVPVCYPYFWYRLTDPLLTRRLERLRRLFF